MNHGQKLLPDWTEEEKIGAIQDYQEMVGELESEVNNALIRGTMILPQTVRAIMEKWVYGRGLQVKITDRMNAWFTPSMLMPSDKLMARLEQLASEYDANEDGISTARFDEIMLESDKIQAELWRRSVHKED